MSHFNKLFGVFSDGGELAGLLALKELSGLLALEKLSGLLALEELSRLLELDGLSGLLELEELSGLLALEEFSGLLALEKLSGLLAINELSGLLTLEKLAKLLSLEELSGSVDEAALADKAVETVEFALSGETPELSGTGSGSADDTVLWLSGRSGIEMSAGIFSRYEQPVIRVMPAASIAASCILNFLIIIY